jgi:pimeloyl-ACP methyl ester carboxylesterase
LAELFAIERGAGGIPVAFLHGFGLSHLAWGDVIERIGPARRLIAFDLPGHGGSLGVPHGSAAVAAKAVLAELARRDIARAHLVGHSMGGAAAALVALRDPTRVASLTLLSPGGFGREINHELLRRYAAAAEEAELAALLHEFFGGEYLPPAGLAAALAKEREAPGATAALVAIVETFFEGTSQKLLPLAELAALGVPVSVAWGTRDRVLPLRDPERLSAHFAVRVFEGVGHMLPWEVPAEVAGLVPASGN